MLDIAHQLFHNKLTKSKMTNEVLIMIKISVKPEVLDQLHYEKSNNPHPRVRKKIEAIILKNNGLYNKKICEILNIAPNTLTTYVRQFKEGGIDKITEINFNKPQSELMKHKDIICADFKKNPPATLKEAMVRIKGLCGLKRSLPQIREFLLKMGLSRKKVAAVPAKANIEQQEEFKKNFRAPIGRSSHR